MKKRIISVILSCVSIFALADEGMWLLMFIKRLNYKDMQEKGLQLTPEEIYSVNHSSLKDAIVHFNEGCTAEIISKEGLVLTNHHCGYESIAELSTPEHDYLTNGFWAYSKDQELKPSSLNVRFLDRMEDVTDRIQSKLDADMTELQRNQVIEDEKELIQKEYTENGKYIVTIASFFKGNEFYMFRYIQYDDVRLVGAPPASVGKYGGDTDNWEWPRHTGDFSIFRVYGDKDGNPAPYAKDNVPLKPNHHFPVSLAGIDNDSYAMILGFPGRTSRYMSSLGIQQAVTYEYPSWVDASKAAMDGMKPYMDKDKAVYLDYADKYASIANYWKNREGMIESIERNKTIDEKQKEEAKLLKWINAEDDRKVEYGTIFPLLEKYYASSGQYYRPFYHALMMLRGSDMVAMPASLSEILDQYMALSDEQKKQSLPEILEKIDKQYENIHPAVEKSIIVHTLASYLDKVPDNLQSVYFKKIGADYGNNLVAFADKLEKNSIFFDVNKVKETFSKGDISSLQSDELLAFTEATIEEYRTNYQNLDIDKSSLEKGERLMAKARIEAYPKEKFYPDANSTMRLTYGTVKTLPRRGERPNDAKENYYTTLQGAVAKYKKGDLEFDMPEKLLSLYKRKDYGQYASKKGYMPVCFLTDNDITGGNSGSPVLNGKGELIGIAFDGNSEALSGDILFEESLQRTISVDIRYVLFIIDKYAGAKNLIDEMTLVH